MYCFGDHNLHIRYHISFVCSVMIECQALSRYCIDPLKDCTSCVVLDYAVYHSSCNSCKRVLRICEQNVILPLKVANNDELTWDFLVPASDIVNVVLFDNNVARTALRVWVHRKTLPPDSWAHPVNQKCIAIHSMEMMSLKHREVTHVSFSLTSLTKVRRQL